MQLSTYPNIIIRGLDTEVRVYLDIAQLQQTGKRNYFYVLASRNKKNEWVVQEKDQPQLLATEYGLPLPSGIDLDEKTKLVDIASGLKMASKS